MLASVCGHGMRPEILKTNREALQKGRELAAVH